MCDAVSHAGLIVVLLIWIHRQLWLLKWRSFERILRGIALYCIMLKFDKRCKEWHNRIKFFFDCETLLKYLEGSKSLNSAKAAHPFKVHQFLNYSSFRLEVEDVIHNEALHAIVHSFGSLSHSEPNINGTKHGKYRYILSLMFPLDSLQKYFCVKLFVFLQFLWVIFAVCWIFRLATISSKRVYVQFYGKKFHDNRVMSVVLWKIAKMKMQLTLDNAEDFYQSTSFPSNPWSQTHYTIDYF